MSGIFDDFKQWIKDMTDHPELIGSELANVGGKISRGLAAVSGGAVEAAGSVGAAVIDIASSVAGNGVEYICRDGRGDSIAKSGERVAKLFRKPFGKVSEAIQSGTSAATLMVSKAVGDIEGEVESRANIEQYGMPMLKQAFGLTVKPRRGSVVKVDLALGAASHTGIYVGRGKVVEVYVDNTKSVLRKVGIKDFLSASLVRTGTVVSVAAQGTKAIYSEKIAKRAEAEYVRRAGKREEYDVFSNNCHMFTRYCITGKKLSEGVYGEAEIEAALSEVFGDGVVWLPIAKV